jgi:hypothetical protein
MQNLVAFLQYEFWTIFVKQFAVCLALIVELVKIDVLELVIKFTKSELNNAK